MKVIFGFADLGDELNTSYWRCFIPSKRLNEAGHSCVCIHINELLHSNFVVEDGIDVIVVERTFVAQLQSKIMEWQECGIKVVGTFDDAYHLINPHSESGQFWRGARTDKTGHYKDFRGSLFLFDRVIVPSRVLVEDYKQFCGDIRYVPNFTHPEMWKNIRKIKNDNIVIGWGGSSEHVRSWSGSGIIPALSRLQRKYPKLSVRIYGGGKQIPQLLRSSGVKCEFVGWVKFEQWCGELAQFDIGVAPLSGNYDDRRSYIKVLEYGLAEIPWIVSEGPPYQECEGGIVVKNKQDKWFWVLDKMMSDVETRRRYASLGNAWAKKQDEAFLSTYEEVLSKWD